MHVQQVIVSSHPVFRRNQQNHSWSEMHILSSLQRIPDQRQDVSQEQLEHLLKGSQTKEENSIQSDTEPLYRQRLMIEAA